MASSVPEGSPTSEVPNRNVLRVAKNFREGAKFLNDRVQEHDAVLPLRMLAAFSIELYLKSLNAKFVYERPDSVGVGGAYRMTAKANQGGHSFVKLLEVIEPPIRVGLEDAYAANPGVPSASTLAEALTVYNSSFVGSRYPYEQGHNFQDPGFSKLVDLLTVIANHVEGLPIQSRLG